MNNFYNLKTNKFKKIQEIKHYILTNNHDELCKYDILLVEIVKHKLLKSKDYVFNKKWAIISNEFNNLTKEDYTYFENFCNDRQEIKQKTFDTVNEDEFFKSKKYIFDKISSNILKKINDTIQQDWKNIETLYKKKYGLTQETFEIVDKNKNVEFYLKNYRILYYLQYIFLLLMLIFTSLWSYSLNFIFLDIYFFECIFFHTFKIPLLKDNLLIDLKNISCIFALNLIFYIIIIFNSFINNIYVYLILLLFPIPLLFVTPSLYKITQIQKLLNFKKKRFRSFLYYL